MADSMEELEPLFDYRRVQPFNVVIVDDDPLDAPPVGCKKKRKTADSAVEENDKKEKAFQVIDCDESEDEEGWLPPPPKMTNGTSKLCEDSTIKQLRLKRQELASLAQSAKDALKAVEESVRQEFDAESMKSYLNASSQSPIRGVAEQPLDTSQDRAKIVITIQDKDGPKQFRVFMDDKFERLFKMYAEKVKLDLQDIVFCFDGDKISPTSTPAGLQMEDGDIIEVHVKRN